MKGIVVIISSILVMALIASFPVWKQNKYHDLQKERTRLVNMHRKLLGELQKKDAVINTLSSRARIEKVAVKMDLGFHTTYNAISE